MSDILEHVGQLVDRWQFSNRARAQKSSIIREILKDSSKPGVINLAGGLPAPELFPVEAIKQACIRVLDKYGPDSLQYSLTTGVPLLKKFLADRISASGLEFSPDSIQITGRLSARPRYRRKSIYQSRLRSSYRRAYLSGSASSILILRC